MLFGWHNSNNFTIGVNKCMPCIQEKKKVQYLWIQWETESIFSNQNLHNRTTNHKFRTRKYVLNKMECFKRHRLPYKSNVLFSRLSYWIIRLKSSREKNSDENNVIKVGKKSHHNDIMQLSSINLANNSFLIHFNMAIKF